MGTAMTFRKDFPAKRQNDFGLENALAGYCRRRWPDKAIAYAAHEWDLTESEASKVIYGHASKNTLNKLLHHRRGGFALFLQLLEDATATRLENFIHQQAEKARNEQVRAAAEERTWAALAARRAELRGVAGEPDQPAG